MAGRHSRQPATSVLYAINDYLAAGDPVVPPSTGGAPAAFVSVFSVDVPGVFDVSPSSGAGALQPVANKEAMAPIAMSEITFFMVVRSS